MYIAKRQKKKYVSGCKKSLATRGAVHIRGFDGLQARLVSLFWTVSPPG